MKALFLLTNPVESPGERYRVFQYLPTLAERGIECTVDVLVGSATYARASSSGYSIAMAPSLFSALRRRRDLLRHAGDYDVVVAYRQPVMVPPRAAERRLQAAGVPFVFDFDEPIYLPNPGAGFATRRVRSPAVVGDTITASSLTIVANETLAAHARLYGARVDVVPTCVDTVRFAPRERPARREVVVGWIGSRSTARYLDAIAPALAEVTAASADVVVRQVGGTAPLRAVRATSARWSLDSEVDELAGFDIGIMPLPDDPWTRGKSGLKLLQYMAAGIPVVASPVGVNAEIVVDGVNGFLAGNLSAWRDRLDALIADPHRRLDMGREGRRTVVERYALHRWAPAYAELLRSAAAAR